jgi:hypothetical protein
VGLIIYADDVNLLEDSIYTTKENAETSVNVSKEIDLEAIAEKINYILLSRHQNVR